MPAGATYTAAITQINVAAGHMAREEHRRTIFSYIAVFLFLAIYIEAPLFFTENFYVPAFLTVFSIPFLALLLRKDWNGNDTAFMVKIVFVLFLSAIFSPDISLLGDKLVGLLQTAVSLAAGVLLLKVISRLDTQTFARIVGVLLVLLVIGAILEWMGPLRQLSDSFRAVVYAKGGYGAYANDARDIQLAGFIRPKLFTSEPSLLAIGFLVLNAAWLLIRYSPLNFLVSSFLTLFMLYLTGSPILVISLGLALAIALFSGKKLTVHLVFLAYAGLFITSLLFLAAVSTGFLTSSSNRMDSLLKNSSSTAITSENLRVVFPYRTLIDVMKVSPLFGVGIGGKEAVGSYSSLGLNSMEALGDNSFALGNNTFATFFTYFGVIGSLLFIAVFAQYLIRAGVPKHALLVLIIAGLAQTMGGFESPRHWGYIFFFIGALTKVPGQKAP